MSDVPSGTNSLATPARTVPVDWGELRASCFHPNRVQFGTYTADSGDSKTLVINRVQYAFAVVLERGELPPERRYNAVQVNNVWYIDRSSSWSLRRIDSHSAAATEAASQIVRWRLMPELGKWLLTPEADELLVEGAVYWSASFQESAAGVEGTLQAALDRVAGLRARVAAGELLADPEETYVRCLRVESH